MGKTVFIIAAVALDFILVGIGLVIFLTTENVIPLVVLSVVGGVLMTGGIIASKLLGR
ncbi:MAG: hypothetical protein AAFX99_18650 [Myxococcota bacterium]